MTFVPYIPTIMSPRVSGATSDGNAIVTKSVLHPIARECDLSLIPAAGYLDYFLYHPYDGTMEALYVSCAPDTTFSDLSLQIIQLNGLKTVTSANATQIGDITIRPRQLPVPGKLGEGPVFLRATSAAVAATILVTIHVQTSEIM